MKRSRTRLDDFEMGGVIGIDPGKSGAISYVDNVAGALVYPIKDYTERDIWERIEGLLGLYDPRLAVLEKVHAMPKQGVSSTFKFGVSFGELRMALIASEIRMELVTPQAWQKSLSCRTGGDKNVSKRKAQELFPKIKMTHAKADALLIAEYGRRFLP
jgi:crossover junction endodeoxyribonuclease RuvC